MLDVKICFISEYSELSLKEKFLDKVSILSPKELLPCSIQESTVKGRVILIHNGSMQTTKELRVMMIECRFNCFTRPN